MELKSFVATNLRGDVIPNAQFTVRRFSDNTLATLFDAAGSSLVNPFLADVSGLGQFAAADGDYSVTMEGGGVSRTLSKVSLFDITANAAAIATNTATAVAAAQASGLAAIYNTKADANAALASLANLAIVEVLSDESIAGSPRTRYRKESGVYVFKINLDRLRSELVLITPKTYVAASDNTTNDATPVANAIAAAGQGGEVRVPADTFIGTARVANPDGVEFTGPGLLRYRPDATRGNRVQNAAGRERYVWGAEYLYQWLVKISAGTAATVRGTGDSTTAVGYGSYFERLTVMLGALPGLTITNAGQSGKTTADWVATYLAADITAAPDLLLWHWGMNPGVVTESLSSFETSLRNGLTTYRASVPLASGGIVLMVPNACSDGANGRDEGRNEKMRQIIRSAAIDFQCAYFDTYGLFQDGYVGIGTWLDDTYTDGIRGVHPLEAFGRIIAGEMLDLIVPRGLRAYVGGGGVVANPPGSASSPAVADSVTTYGKGISIRRAQAANPYLWPIDGYVMTMRGTDATGGVQILWTYNSAQSAQMRHWNTSTAAWTAWSLIGTQTAPGTPLSTDVSTTYPLGTSIARGTAANGWPLDGFVVTHCEATNSTYAIQYNYSYTADIPPRVRTYTTGGWGAWRSLGGAVDPANALVTMVSGNSTTIANGTHRTLLDAAATIAAYTVVFPTSPVDGEEHIITTTQTITALTLTAGSGTSFARATPTTLAANGRIAYIYRAANTSWYPS